MESKPDKQFVEPLLKTLRKFQNNNRCLYPGCPKEPIGSHVIAESFLERIADDEGKVLTWDVSDNDIVVSTLQGHEWDYVYKLFPLTEKWPFANRKVDHPHIWGEALL